ncbi:MAG: transglycosylase SLT domain-containing protein [Merismopedia sp. SIO2A8]|nr:transglycosylase SLT domain-containing protein [Merismopedia sp. SIO2A8]
MQKLKQWRPRQPIGIGTFIGLSLVVGMGSAACTGNMRFGQVSPSQGAESTMAADDAVNGKNSSARTSALPQASSVEETPDSLVLPLALLSPEERADDLMAVATGTHLNQSQAVPFDQSRARYLLAVDARTLGQPTDAIAHLENLEADYPGMESAILYQRALAQDASGDLDAAQQTWQRLIQVAPNQPFAAEGLYALGQREGESNSPYWEQAIAQFPSHPRTLDIARAALETDPNQPQMLLLLAHHGLHDPNIVTVLDRLTQDYADQLQPIDWEAIGFAYWEKWQYDKAGKAYDQAPATPLNAYRAGRGAHLGGRIQDAIAHYQAAVQQFPEAKDTAQAFLHLSRLVRAESALTYLDQFHTSFPERQSEGLLARAKVLEKLNSPLSAQQAKQSILSQYSDSDTAADIRWEKTQEAIDAGQLQQAWQWAGQLVKENPKSSWAPEAAFWVGKWAKQLGHSQEATQAFNYVLKTYPSSYYAWRSATQLGWDVGDFQTVRRYSPALTVDWQRSPLPAGSPMLQELYLLGQDKDAWGLWQVEFQTPRDPTVAEQFTDGVLKVRVGQYLTGIFLLDNLDWRAREDGPFTADVATQTSTYAYTVYPFPYRDVIRAWSHQNDLNPVLVTALMRQESRFQPAIKSVAGATGLMQVMPATADWIANQIDLDTYNLTSPQDSIKLGTWYLSYTHGEYADNSMFAIASYNAGPGNVAKWIDRFGTRDLDTFVTQIPFPETKGYVTSVFENYWNYLQLYNTELANQLQRHQQ